MGNRRTSKGFTLLELIVAIAVTGIILSVGVPSFISIIQNNRAVAHTNDLVTGLNLARSEATRRSSVVTVCSSTNGTTCNGGNDWSTGWLVRNGAGEVLRTWPERSGGAGILTATTSQVQFQPRGSLAAAGPLFRVRLPNCTNRQGRDIAVNVAGRISVTRVDC